MERKLVWVYDSVGILNKVLYFKDRLGVKEGRLL